MYNIDEIQVIEKITPYICQHLLFSVFVLLCFIIVIPLSVRTTHILYVMCILSKHTTNKQLYLFVKICHNN